LKQKLTPPTLSLVGSDFYVSGLTDPDFQKIALYLNFDVMASPNFGYFIYDSSNNVFDQKPPNGSKQIETLIANYFKSAKITTAPTEMDGRSDYSSFFVAGVPVGSITTGASKIKTTQQAGWWGGQSGVACKMISSLPIPTLLHATTKPNLPPNQST
jgi:Zn-dependent M28 family amino/carboxypeptidase